jgi:cysteine desulfurase family protein (TIGR01976 family)
VLQAIERIRSLFPALASKRVFFDGPGGTQVPHQVIDRMNDYLVNMNANHDGAFSTSRLSDALTDEARAATADFIHAAKPEEVIFGPNMTTLTLSLSRSIATELQPGDEIIVTRLDHDANISPWLHVARDRSCTIHWLDFDPQDCTLDLKQLKTLLNERTRLVAVGYASNAVGTINPISQIIERAHEVGALCYIDAVHYAPHGPIDVQSLDCDFLVASAYKFFGPHIGVLYGKARHLERLQAYKVRPAPDEPPGKFETGTNNFEGIAGILGTFDYLAQVGELLDIHGNMDGPDNAPQRRSNFKQLMKIIKKHEMELSQTLIDTLQEIPGLRIWGISDPNRIQERVPTVSFTLEGLHPRTIAEELDQEGIQVWDGNYYALAVTERLGLEETGGMVRVGLIHYNTLEEIERLGEAVWRIAQRP